MSLERRGGAIVPADNLDDRCVAGPSAKLSVAAIMRRSAVANSGPATIPALLMIQHSRALSV